LFSAKLDSLTRLLLDEPRRSNDAPPDVQIFLEPFNPSNRLVRTRERASNLPPFPFFSTPPGHFTVFDPPSRVPIYSELLPMPCNNLMGLASGEFIRGAVFLRMFLWPSGFPPFEEMVFFFSAALVEKLIFSPVAFSLSEEECE